MKKYRLWNVAAHGNIVLSIVFIVLFVIDRFNPSMEFLGSEQSDWLLLIYCIVGLTNGIISAARLMRHDIARKMRADRTTHGTD